MKAKANFHKELLRGHKFSPKRFWNVIKSIRYEKKRMNEFGNYLFCVSKMKSVAKMLLLAISLIIKIQDRSFILVQKSFERKN